MAKNNQHPIDYQQILRNVAKSMVRLKRPERLLKMITRFVDKELGLTHTSILVLEEKRNRFIFVDSKGSRRLPTNLIKFDLDHPLVAWFQKKNKLAKQDYISLPDVEGKENSFNLSEEDVVLVKKLLSSMKSVKVELAIPGYFKRSLLGLLLFGKKKDGSPFSEEEISFFQVLAQDCSMVIKTVEYHRDLLERNDELAGRLQEIEHLRQKEQERYYEIMRSLAQEVYEKDNYTFGHVNQVERLGLMTAKELGLDLSGRRKDILSAGLILHDVGKIGIPDNVLKKKSKLDPDEWEIMKTHVDKGVKILEPLSDFKEVREIVHCHHEKVDGTGYPRGLKGDQIPIESRIVSVVDAYHAIVSTRCYSKGRPVEVALEELKRCAGTHFDPDVVNAFIRGMRKEMKKRGRYLPIDEINGE